MRHCNQMDSKELAPKKMEEQVLMMQFFKN